MDEKNWPLTSKAIADSERAAGPGEHELTDEAESEPRRGNSLIQELVAEGILEEVTPGRYWASKLRPDRDKLV